MNQLKHLILPFVCFALITLNMIVYLFNVQHDKLQREKDRIELELILKKNKIELLEREIRDNEKEMDKIVKLLNK